MKSILIIVLFISSLLATRYEVDQNSSRVGFEIRHAVVAKVEGQFNEFSGLYDYDDQLHYFKSFHGEAKMASVDTQEKYRDAHLRDKVFDVEHYPIMRLEMLRQNGSNFEGNLTIKGISKEVNLTIGRSLEVPKMFLLQGEISRKDFNLTFSDMAELGGVAVGDKVTISIEFLGTPQQ